ncbi:MAG: glycosyltransferase family 39 protein [Gemmataceae bacterium]|nr:glycosyltransferase family 39 protein [Gemmataceae bacterium]
MTALHTAPQHTRTLLDGSPRLPESSAATHAGWPTFLALLVIYLAGHLTLRLFGNETLLFDEAEQFVLGQTFAWGYNTQPPLMTWCFRALAAVFGDSVATLTVLRYGFLGAMYGFLYASARCMLGDRRQALAAAAALLLIPAIGWEAVNDRVHTTKLCALCLATFYATLRVLHDSRTRWYVLLGVCLGLGPLCKYNYALFVAALVIATLSLRGYRRRLDLRRLLVSAAIATVIVLPHLWWLQEHYQDVVALIEAKGLAAEGGGVIGRLRGLASIAENVVYIAGPVIAVFLLCFPQALTRRPCPAADVAAADFARWLQRFLACSLALLTAVVLAGGLAHIRLYWMLPMLTVTPLVLFLRLERQPIRRWQWPAFACAVLVSVGVVAVARVAKARGNDSQDALYRDLARRLRDDGFHGGPVLTLGHREAGNLRLFFPEARVVCSVYPAFTLPDTLGRRPRLLLWDASHFDRLPPQWRAEYRKQVAPRVPAVPVRYVAVPEGFERSRVTRLGYVVLPE